MSYEWQAHVENLWLDWQAHVEDCRTRGVCEFSGLKPTECVQSICDCFETLEGAKALEKEAEK